MYDLFIFALAFIGIAGALYFSHKISSHPVRHVGMVRTLPGAEAKTEDRAGQASPTEAEVWLQYDPDEEGKALHRKDWKCEQCGLTQNRSKDLRCRRCAAKYAEEGNEQMRAEEAADTNLEVQVQRHDGMLEKHFEMIASLEMKVRKLEVESLRNSQQTQKEPAGTIAEDYRN